MNTINAKIDCKKDVVTIGLDNMTHEFNFAKFRRQPHDKELPSKDEIIGLASIALPPNDPLEQYLLDHENDMFMNERREIDEVFFKQGPILKHNLPVEILGDPPPPKGDPVFELKPLPDNLKYAYLDEKKIYPIIISANLSEHEEERLLKTHNNFQKKTDKEVATLKAQITSFKARLSVAIKEKIQIREQLLDAYSKEERLLRTYGALLRKYTNLSNSKLGKLQLSYWRKKSAKSKKAKRGN